jgi:hypothetical protein
MQAPPALRTHSALLVIRASLCRVWGYHHSGDALPIGKSLSAVAVEETTRRTTGAVLSGKRRGLPLKSKRPSVPERAPPRHSETQRVGPSAEQMALGEGWNHSVRGGGSSTPQPLSTTGHGSVRAAKSDRHQEDGRT